MYDKNYITQLKRTNISADAEKTKERVEALWKGASKQQKHEVEALAGVVRASILRIWATGVISAKLAVPIAQVMNADPFYLTGETDENNGCDSELLARFLEAKGYAKMKREIKIKRPAVKKAPPIQPVQPVQQPDIPYIETPEEKPTPVYQFTEEELIALIRALLIRARADEKAARQLETVKAALLG